MRKRWVWVAGFLVLLVGLCAWLVLHNGGQDSGEEATSDFAGDDDPGGGFIQISDGGPGASFLLICLSAKEGATTTVDGLELNPLGLMPIRTKLYTRTKSDVPVPAYRDKPTVVLVDESGEIAFERCPVDKGKLGQLLEAVQNSKAYYSGRSGSEAAGAEPSTAPRAKNAPHYAIAGLLECMRNSKQPWPKKVVDAVDAYVARTNEQRASDLPAGLP